MSETPTVIARIRTGEPNGGLLVMPDPLTITHRELIVALASRHRLPAAYPYRFFVTSGGLMSYGIDRVDLSADQI